MRKRGNNEGSISRHGDKFIVQMCIGYDEHGKLKRKSRSAASMVEARAILRELQDLYAAGANIDDNITLGEWATRCLEAYIKPRVRPNTYDGYEYICRCYLLRQPTARVKLFKFRELQLQELINQMEGGPRLKKYVYQFYKLIFNHAVENGVLPANPIKKISLPRQNKREYTEMPTDELNEILAKLQPHPMFYLGYLIMLCTGMRRSELLGLTWADFNQLRRTLSINKAVIMSRNKALLADTKSAQSNRLINIPQILCDLLEEQRLAQKVFTRHIIHNKGEIYNPRAFTRAISRRAGVDYLKSHDLRHSYATKLVREGVNIRIVQELLGHADIRLTLQTYSHVLDAEKQNAANVIANIYFGKPVVDEAEKLPG